MDHTLMIFLGTIGFMYIYCAVGEKIQNRKGS